VAHAKKRKKSDSVCGREKINLITATYKLSGCTTTAKKMTLKGDISSRSKRTRRARYPILNETTWAESERK